MSDIIGKATVQITVEVSMDSVWGDDCSVGQIFKQASREAVDKLTRNLHNDPNNAPFRIVGTPIVSGIVTTRK